MSNGIRTGDLRGFNKGRSSKFCIGSWVRQTPEEGRMTYRPKRCRCKNKEEDNSPKTLNDEYHQASSKKFRQLAIRIVSFIFCYNLLVFWFFFKLFNSNSLDLGQFMALRLIRFIAWILQKYQDLAGEM